MLKRKSPNRSSLQVQMRRASEETKGLQKPHVIQRGFYKRVSPLSSPNGVVNNVEYIISAEFDNKQGPVIKHQYPKNLPGFKNVNSSLSNLAGLMIPNGIENKPGESDFTTFILYKDRYTQSFLLFPSDQGRSPVKYSNDSAGRFPRSPSRLESVILEEDESASSSSGQSIPIQLKEIPLFFINVVHAKIDTSNERGAIIKSVAVGSLLQNFFIFKPLLMMTLGEYIKTPNIQILVECFNMINSLDLSLMNRIHSNKVLQNILNSINNEDIINEIFDLKEKSLKKILRLEELPERDQNGNSITFKQGCMVYHFDSFIPSVLPSHFTKIPLQVDLIKYNAIKLNINYKDHVLKFLTEFIPKISQLPRYDPSWRLIVNSTNLTKDSLCQFVLALSNFISAFDDHYFHNSLVIIFPYMDISMIDELRNEFSVQKSGNFFSIIGVSNPIFEMQKDVWDFYYDLDRGSLHSQKTPPPSSTTVPGSSGSHTTGNRSSELLMKIFNKNNHPNVILRNEPSKMGLLLKFIQYIVLQQHDNQTVLNVFKRVIILQLVHLFRKLNHESTSSIEMLLKDEYMLTYKDFVMFPEFFEYSSLKVIRLLYDLESCLQAVFFPKTQPREVIKRILNELHDHLKNLYKFMSVNKTNMGKFLNVCLNYPLTHPFEPFDLAHTDFSKINLTRVLRHEMKHTEALDGLCYGQTNVIDYFSLDKGLSLVFYPLLISPLLDTTLSDAASSLHSAPSNSILSTPRTNKSKQTSNTKSKHDSIASQSDGNLSAISSIYENYCDSESVHSVKDSSMSFTSSMQDVPSIIDRIKKLTVRLLMRIEKHHIGSMLINKKLNPMFPVTYHALKREHFPEIYATKPGAANNADDSPTKATFDASADSISAEAAVVSPSPKTTNSETKLTPNRHDLLQELQMISKKQKSAEDENQNLRNTTQSVLNIVEPLSKLELVSKSEFKVTRIDDPRNISNKTTINETC